MVNRKMNVILNIIAPLSKDKIISYKVLYTTKLDGIVKNRHSRENGNPENSNYLKILDSCLRGNDGLWAFQTFYENIKYGCLSIFFTKAIFSEQSFNKW